MHSQMHRRNNEDVVVSCLVHLQRANEVDTHAVPHALWYGSSFSSPAGRSLELLLAQHTAQLGHQSPTSFDMPAHTQCLPSRSIFLSRPK